MTGIIVLFLRLESELTANVAKHITVINTLVQHIKNTELTVINTPVRHIKNTELTVNNKIYKQSSHN
jgi:hypothetical protein